MHRDIKPGNIIVVTSFSPNVQFVDFGAATADTQSFNHMAGTIRYLAPEVIALKNKESKIPYDRAIDIWGLGLVAYELSCRKFISFDYIIWENFVKLKDRLASTKWVPGDISELIQRMLQWSASGRISAAELLQSLGGMVSENVDHRVAAKHSREK